LYFVQASRIRDEHIQSSRRVFLQCLPGRPLLGQLNHSMCKMHSWALFYKHRGNVVYFLRTVWRWFSHEYGITIRSVDVYTMQARKAFSKPAHTVRPLSSRRHHRHSLAARCYDVQSMRCWHLLCQPDSCLSPVHSGIGDQHAGKVRSVVVHGLRSGELLLRPNHPMYGLCGWAIFDDAGRNIVCGVPAVHGWLRHQHTVCAGRDRVHCMPCRHVLQQLTVRVLSMRSRIRHRCAHSVRGDHMYCMCSGSLLGQLGGRVRSMHGGVGHRHAVGSGGAGMPTMWTRPLLCQLDGWVCDL
jgi:hypothetical protein